MSKGMWTKHYASDGTRFFYYNASKKQSLWQPPPDSVIHEAPNLKPQETLVDDESGVGIRPHAVKSHCLTESSNSKDIVDLHSHQSSLFQESTDLNEKVDDLNPDSNGCQSSNSASSHLNLMPVVPIPSPIMVDAMAAISENLRFLSFLLFFSSGFL